MWRSWTAYKHCYDQIRAALILKTPEGDDISEWILHIEGDKA